MKLLLPFVLLFGAALGLAYVKEIDRLERDMDPAESGKKLMVISFCALGLSFLFTLLSADAGLIVLILSGLLIAVLAGINAGQKLAWHIYCRRNPELTDEEE